MYVTLKEQEDCKNYH